MKKFLIQIFGIFLGFLVVGCSSSSVQPQEQITQQENLNLSIEKEMDKSDDLSKWYVDQDEKVPLTIVGVAYIDPELKKTKEYQQYKRFLEIIKQNPSELALLISPEILEKFSPITVVDFEENHDKYLRFSAVYENKDGSVETLNDILRFDNDTKSKAEMLIHIDFKRLQAGEFVIDGYKTIKTEDKEQNSGYYTIVRKNYALLTPQQQKKMILQSFAAALQLSLQDYIIVNREELYNAGKKLRFMKKTAPEQYKASIYALKKQSAWEKLVKKQKMYITPIPKEDIETLYKNNYIGFNDTTLTLQQIDSLVNVLDRSFFDPVLVASYPQAIADMTGSDILYQRDTVIVNIEDEYDLEDIVTASKIDTQQAGFEKIYQNSHFIENDIDTEFAFAVLDYMQKFDNPKDAPLNNVYVQFKDSKVYALSNTRPKHIYDPDKGIDTLLYKNGMMEYLYSKTEDNRFRFLLFFGGDGDYCSSAMFRPSWDNLFFIPLAYTISYGLLLGSYQCTYDKSLQNNLIENAGFRDLKLFKSEL